MANRSAVLAPLLALVVAVPIGAFDGAMGFARRVEFPASSGPSIHWISIPWQYQPVDVGTPGILDAEDLCADLGGASNVAAIVRWNEATSTFVEHLCGLPSPFPIVQGVGYGVRNASFAEIRGMIAGAHDDALAFSIPATGGSQLSWLSVPYHLRSPDRGGDLVVTAADLCDQVGTTDLLAIVSWNEVAGLFESFACGSSFSAPFTVERGTAYGFVNRGTQTISWQPVHY